MLYGPLIRRWLQQHDTPEADADDLAQEVLLVLARDLGDFDHNGRTGAFRLWVRSITANRLRDYWRRTDRGPSTVLTIASPSSKTPKASLAGSATASTTNSSSGTHGVDTA